MLLQSRIAAADCWSTAHYTKCWTVLTLASSLLSLLTRPARTSSSHEIFPDHILVTGSYLIRCCRIRIPNF